MPLTSKVVYHDIVISDHAPLSFSFNVSSMPQCDRIQTLNPQLLKQPTFCDLIREQIFFFFEMNDRPETPPLILWETMKAYIRGCIISYQAGRKKRKRAKLVELEQQINCLDKENAAHPSIKTYKKILSLRFKYNQILSDRIIRGFLHTQQKCFEFGDKPYKLLARQIRKMESDRAMSKVKSENCDILTSHNKSMRASNNSTKNYTLLGP